jgi:hypothetical protein
MILSRIFVIISIVFMIGMAGCSLAADVTPPPGYISPAPETSTAITLALPSATGEPSGETAPELSVTPESVAGLGNGQAPSILAETTPSQSSGVAIDGRVVNDTDTPLPPDLKVTLQGYNGMQPELSWTADIQPDGSFLFPDVKAAAGWVYVASVDYKNVTFNSDIIHGNDLLPGQTYSTNVTVHETSSDISSLIVDRMHVILDFSKPGLLQVVELFIISNPTNQVIIPIKDGQPLLKFVLPTGATNLQFQGGGLGDRFVQTADGFGDIQEIAPGNGQQQVLFAYDLPYHGSTSLNLIAPLPVAAVVVMLPSGSGIQVQSTRLQYSGQRAAQGMNLDLYTTTNLVTDTSLPITITGDPRAGNGAFSLPGNHLTIGIIIFVFALAGSGIYYFNKRHELNKAVTEAGTLAEDSESTNTDKLLDAIIALDDMHKAGELPEDVYLSRRAELKGLLKRSAR